MKVFEVGKEYSMSSICDHECVWRFKVIGRTEKTITLVGLNNKEGGVKRINKQVSEWNGCETVYPLGRYSMAPALRAEAVF